MGVEWSIGYFHQLSFIAQHGRYIVYLYMSIEHDWRTVGECC